MKRSKEKTNAEKMKECKKTKKVRKTKERVKMRQTRMLTRDIIFKNVSRKTSIKKGHFSIFYLFLNWVFISVRKI
jgi:hypothetical protein